MHSELHILEAFVTDNKKQIMTEVLSNRTRHVTIVLEDIFQPHNASATIRTADCLGVQDIHIIQNRNPFKPSKTVLRGAGKWMSLHEYKDGLIENVDINHPEDFPVHNTKKCLQSLKDQGYQLVATSPGEHSITLKELSLKQPTAFLFGTEAYGLTETALEMADETLRLPMVGFTESYNISVSVAITLSQTMRRLWDSDIEWHMSEDEQKALLTEWFKRAIGPVKASQILERNHYTKTSETR